MLSLCYVCKTRHIDRVGLRIEKQFYVDVQGREVCDLHKNN